MERTKEHNKKISESMKRHFLNESAEEKEKRIATLKKAKYIQSELYKRYKFLSKIMDKEIIL